MRTLLLVGLLCTVAASEPLDELVENRVDETADWFDVPSISVAVVSGNATLLTYSPGEINVARHVGATSRSVYALASVTKPMTATALLLLLHDRDDLTRTDEVKPFLDGVVHASSNLGGITFEHVLSHRLAITDLGPSADDEYLLWEDRRPDLRLNRALSQLVVSPSTQVRYSNRTYLIAGYLLARLAGEGASPVRTDHDYETAMDKLVFRPLFMRQTANSPTPRMVEQLALPYRWDGLRFVPLEQRRFRAMPAGEAYSSALDLARFLRAHVRPGVPAFPGQGSLPAEVVVPMRTPAGTTASDNVYGLGWWIWDENGRTFVDHDGVRNGYRAYLVFEPARKAGLCFLTNGHCSETIFGDFYWVAVEVISLLAGQPIPAPAVDTFGPPAPPPPFPRPPTDLPQEMYLLTRDLDTVVARFAPDGLSVAAPGQHWRLVVPATGANQKYPIALLTGGAYRSLPGAPPATFTTKGLAWGADLAQRPFAPAAAPNLAPYQGAWGGTVQSEPDATPIELTVTANGVQLGAGPRPMRLIPASDAAGRLIAVGGSDLRRMVRLVLESHAGGAELVGTWQSGPERRLVHLRRGAPADWRARVDPRRWLGTWQGDVARELDWTGAKLVVTQAKATIESGALGLRDAPLREVRWTGNRVSFAAGNWTFSGRIVGHLLAGAARSGHRVARYRLRRTGN